MVLVDCRDPRAMRRSRICLEHDTVHPYDATVWGLVAGHELDERRFSRPVLADQGVYFSRSYFERNLVEGDDPRERLRHAIGDEKWSFDLHQSGYDRRGQRRCDRHWRAFAASTSGFR